MCFYFIFISAFRYKYEKSASQSLKEYLQSSSKSSYRSTQLEQSDSSKHIVYP